MKTIELTIVATRRPKLLQSTLKSFDSHVFRFFNFSRVAINIDPIRGDDQDLNECIKLMNDTFHEPVILTPQKPGHCAAVKRLWSGSQSDFILHLKAIGM